MAVRLYWLNKASGSVHRGEALLDAPRGGALFVQFRLDNLVCEWTGAQNSPRRFWVSVRTFCRSSAPAAGIPAGATRIGQHALASGSFRGVFQNRGLAPFG